MDASASVHSTSVRSIASSQDGLHSRPLGRLHFTAHVSFVGKENKHLATVAIQASTATPATHSGVLKARLDSSHPGLLQAGIAEAFSEVGLSEEGNIFRAGKLLCCKEHLEAQFTQL